MRFFAALIGVLGVIFSGCYRSGESTCNQEDSPLAPLRGTTKNARTQAPLANVHVFVEVCGRYTENTNPAKGHPNYRYGTVSDSAGKFEVMVPSGQVGLHTFKPYFQYGTVFAPSFSSAEIDVPMEPNGDRPDSAPADDAAAECKALAETCAQCPLGDLQVACSALVSGNAAAACGAAVSEKKYATCTGRTAVSRPVLTSLSSKTTIVVAGGMLQFTVNAKGDPKDPLSEEVLLLQPETQVARAFDPPVRGAQALGFANGTWKLAVAAPAKPGVYRYYASVSSEGCVTGVGEPMMNTANGQQALDNDRTPMRQQPFVSITVQ
jgi:hypothetical protein